MATSTSPPPTLLSGPNILVPMDLGVNYGNRQFQDQTSIASNRPTVGDTYAILLTYTTGDTETLYPQVTAVLGGLQVVH